MTTPFLHSHKIPLQSSTLCSCRKATRTDCVRGWGREHRVGRESQARLAPFESRQLLTWTAGLTKKIGSKSKLQRSRSKDSYPCRPSLCPSASRCALADQGHGLRFSQTGEREARGCSNRAPVSAAEAERTSGECRRLAPDIE